VAGDQFPRQIDQDAQSGPEFADLIADRHAVPGQLGCNLRSRASPRSTSSCISSRNVTIKSYGEAAVMHGIVDMSIATGGGRDEMLHLQFVLVWAREAGRWRLTLRQTTRIP
jgi:hypothetical protein